MSPSHRSSPLFRAPGFGLIAIAGSTAEVDHILALARGLRGHRLALMLRDPAHRRHHIADLARHLLAGPIPPNLVPIAGAHAMPDIRWVHLTSAQLAGEEAPGDGAWFGGSAHTIEEGLAAARLGARYVTFSPIFPTASKPGHPGVGLGVLRAFCEAVPLPVFALGGIDPANAASCIAAGARGLASISLFSSAPDLHALAAMIERGRGELVTHSFPENPQP